MNLEEWKTWKVKAVKKNGDLFQWYLMADPDWGEHLMQPSMLTDNAPAKLAVARYIQKQLSEELWENTPIQNQTPKTYSVDQQTQKFIYKLLAAGAAAAWSAIILKEIGKWIRKAIEDNPHESVGLLFMVLWLLYAFYGPKFPENNPKNITQNPDERELEIEADLNLTVRAKVTEKWKVTSEVTVHNK